jgi:hypothetical protein
MTVEERKLSKDEERAQVTRDNAFRDLAEIVNKLQGQSLQVVKIPNVLVRTDVGDQPMGLLVYQNPGDVAAMVGHMMHKVKQLEIALNVLTSMVLEKNLIDLSEFMVRCARDAEETARTMRRGQLSLGTQGRSIIRPN